MKKNKLIRLLTTILSFCICIGSVFAFSWNGYADNLHGQEIDTIKGRIEFSVIVNYGQPVTEDNQVTININVVDSILNPAMFQYQFSLDQKNWYGYDGEWKKNHYSSYQSYYPNYPIGNISGTKTIYGRVYYQGVLIRQASTRIQYSPPNERPKIGEPIFVENQSTSSVGFQDTKIMEGAGTKENPYIVNSTKTKVMINTPNSIQGMYSLDGNAWSSWIPIQNQKANFSITLNNTSGEQGIYMRTKNKYGIESDTRIIYYFLDQSRPSIEIISKYHALVATDGNIEFELGVSDQYAKELDFQVEIYIGNLVAKKEGTVQLGSHIYSTDIPVMITQLPAGKFMAKVTATDEAGNQGSRTFTIMSYDSNEK